METSASLRYEIIGLVAILLIILIVFLLRRNRKDKTSFEDAVRARELEGETKSGLLDEETTRKPPKPEL